MPILTGRQKLFVVQRLACFYSLSEVCEQLKEEFGINVATNQIARYKVGCASADRLSKPLVDAFDAARREFLLNEQAAPIMHKSYRARELHWMYERTRSTAPVVAARILEQAAREAGGMFARPSEFGDGTSNYLISAEIERQIQRDADLIYGPEPDAAK